MWRTAARQAPAAHRRRSTGPACGSHSKATSRYFVDLQLSTTTRISETPIGSDANGAAFQPTLSGDGNVIAFTSGATNLDPTVSDSNARTDVHVRNQRSAVLRRLSQTVDGTQADGDSQRPALSYNGTRLAFDSDAANLAVGGAVGQTDVFQRANPTTSDNVFGANFE
jgi:Tol biopolymer transport system component